MKLIARVKSRENGVLQLQVDNLRSCEEMQELAENEFYTVELTHLRDTRTKKQNKYMWKLIHEIAQKYGEADEWNIYINALERANVKYEYLQVLPKAEKLLKQNFRAVKFMKQKTENGIVFHVYKCFYGSSKFTKEEMEALINCILEIAVNVGIDTGFYESVLAWKN